MAKLYTLLDAKILQAISELGPRNFAEIARRVGIPQESLRYRLKRMHSNPHIFLRIASTTYHTNLGLKKAVVVLKAAPGLEQTLFECLKANEYWIYLCRCYGKFEGCLAVYTIPVEQSDKFERFIQKIKELGIATDSNIFWSTCFQPGTLTLGWFNKGKGEWGFHWDKWIEQLKNVSTNLPHTLIDPDCFHNYADEIDVFILKELEKNATKTLKEIADMLEISLQKAHYHYKKHLVEKKLLEGFEIFIHPHNSVCDMLFFFFDFHNYETMAKFTMSLLDKHFVRFVGKILNKHSLLATLYMPRTEFRKFVDKLSSLARMKLVQNYDYVILDLKTGKRQTFPYEFFKDGKWLYNHKKHIGCLQKYFAR